MSSALATAAPEHAPPIGARTPLRVVVRPAPRREPPFDDELSEPSRAGRYDRHLPFAIPGPQRVRLRPVTGPLGLPDPAAWGRRLLVGLIECADGRRPLHQLASMLSMSITRGLRQDFEQSGASTTRWLRHGTVRSVLVCCPVDGVAELSATLECGARVRAVALRLEERHGRWCCTRLQLG